MPSGPMSQTKERAEFITDLSDMIAQIEVGHPVRVAIDGIDGAGKTTLADELVEPIRRLGREVIRSSVDGFHNPRELRYRRGRWSPEGYFYDSFDYRSVRETILEPLGPLGDRKYRVAKFDYRTDWPCFLRFAARHQTQCCFFDGVFLLRHELIGMWDLTIFLDVSFENAGKRCAARAGDGVVVPEHEARYFDGQRLYLRFC